MGMDERLDAIQVRCSRACVHAALTALLSSAIIFSMIKPLERIKEFQFLDQYYQARIELNVVIQDLEGDICWSSYTKTEAGKKALEEWPMGKFLNWECTYPLESSTTSESYKNTTTFKGNAERSITLKAPAAPSNIRSSHKFWQFSLMTSILSSLLEGQILEKARQYSWEFYGPIRRWENLVNGIFTSKSPRAFGFHVWKWKSKFLKDDLLITDVSFFVNEDAILKYLTMNDIKNIASYEMDSFKFLESRIAEIDKVTLPTFGTQFTIKSGSLLILSVVCIAMIYFFGFYSESQRWPKFPLEGTLFSIIYRNMCYLILFLVLMTIPAIASSLLAYTSLGLILLNTIPASLTVIITVLIVISQLKGLKAKARPPSNKKVEKPNE